MFISEIRFFLNDKIRYELYWLPTMGRVLYCEVVVNTQPYRMGLLPQYPPHVWGYCLKHCIGICRPNGNVLLQTSSGYSWSATNSQVQIHSPSFVLKMFICAVASLVLCFATFLEISCEFGERTNTLDQRTKTLTYRFHVFNILTTNPHYCISCNKAYENQCIHWLHLTPSLKKGENRFIVKCICFCFYIILKWM